MQNITFYSEIIRPVCPYVSNVVVIIKKIQCSVKIFDSLIIRQLHIVCGIMAICASTSGIPAFSRASRTALKSSGAVMISKLSSSSLKSSAPASRAVIISSSASISPHSSSSSSLSMMIWPFWSNIKDTHPCVPMLPLPW